MCGRNEIRNILANQQPFGFTSHGEEESLCMVRGRDGKRCLAAYGDMESQAGLAKRTDYETEAARPTAATKELADGYFKRRTGSRPGV